MYSSKPQKFSIPNQNMHTETAHSSAPSCEVHVIVGPMFAGKTTTLLHRIQAESNNGSSLTDAHQVFDKVVNRNVVIWTSLISGYGHLGGLVDEGWDYFLSMTRDYGIQPRGQHYAAMVDLLGRSGKLREAYDFVLNSPCKEHPAIWGALLGACRIHGDMDVVKLAADKYFELDPENAGTYVVLSNAYATFGFWENLAALRSKMRNSGVIKETAYSRIEIQGELDVIGIDEAQFFEDLYDFCCEAADHDGKTVIVAGLDGDYLRRSFGSVLDIIPLADSVMKLNSSM
ncbi:hypothetical protein REPUB_Repub13aG0278300 [Reevesia pubescens]